MSVMILFLFPNVNLVIKSNSMRFVCKAVQQVGCPNTVQLFALFVKSIQKVRADDFDLHTYLKM